MRLQGTLVGQLTAEHIASLAADHAGESRVLEFKRELPGHATEDRKEFLADVSALANTAGGVIVYGVATQRDGNGHDTGIADEIVGLPGLNLDKEKQRLLSMLHDGIRPSLAAAVATQEVAVPGAPGRVLVLGVGQSLSRPHMITYAGANRFWRRNDVSKYQPDVTELRAMFLEAQSWVTEAEAFRDRRIARIVNDIGTPPGLVREPALYVHVLPLGRLAEFIDLTCAVDQIRTVAPPGGSVANTHFNADGYLTHDYGAKDSIPSYVQWLRFGGAEAFTSRILTGRHDRGGRPRNLFFASNVDLYVPTFAKAAIAQLSGALRRDPPYVVLVSLDGVQGTVIAWENSWMYGREVPITETSFRLPSVVIEDPGADVETALRPVLDILWQAGGYPHAPQPG
jgi:hypothetical protein